jgi:TadE-like protein
VAEFSLVAVLALTVTLALVQLAVFLYQRNAVMTALSDGARLAATAGREPADGRRAACLLLDQTIGDRCGRIRVTVDERDGLVVLSGSGTLPGYLPMVPDLPVRLTARMHDEEDLFRDKAGGEGRTGSGEGRSGFRDEGRIGRAR